MDYSTKYLQDICGTSGCIPATKLRPNGLSRSHRTMPKVVARLIVKSTTNPIYNLFLGIRKVD